MPLPMAVLRWPFLLRAGQILCCIICLGGAGYIANADDSLLWGNGRNVTYLALFVALYGMLVSSLMIAAILSKGTISRVLPGLIDVINSGLATIFFIIIGAAAINVKPPWCTTAPEFTWTSITNATNTHNNFAYNSTLPSGSTSSGGWDPATQNATAAVNNGSSITTSSSSTFGQPTCSAWDAIIVMGFFNALLYAICTVFGGLDMKRGRGLISITDNGKVGPGSFHPAAAAAALGVGRWTPPGTAMPLQAGATGAAAAAAAGSSPDHGSSSGGGGSDGSCQPWSQPLNANTAAAAAAAATGARIDPFLWATSSGGSSRPSTAATAASTWNVHSPPSPGNRLVVPEEFSDYPAQPQSDAAAAAAPTAAAARMAPLTAAANKLPVRSRNQQGVATAAATAGSSGDWSRQLLSTSPGAAAVSVAATAAEHGPRSHWQQQRQQLRQRYSSSSGDPTALVAAAADRSEAMIGTSMNDYWQYWYGNNAAQQQQQQPEQQLLNGSFGSSHRQQQQQQPGQMGNGSAHSSFSSIAGVSWQQQQQRGGAITGQQQQQQQQRPLMTIEQFEAMQS